LFFILKKIAYQLITLFGVVSIVFVLFNALSSDPSKLLVGQRTNAASLEQAKKALHLDVPAYQKQMQVILNIIQFIQLAIVFGC
jgi:peptide/nickel transport system permease protein